MGPRRPCRRPWRLPLRARQPQGQLPDAGARGRGHGDRGPPVRRRCRDLQRGIDARNVAVELAAATPQPPVQVLPRELGLGAGGVAQRVARCLHPAAEADVAATVGRPPPAGAMITHLFVYGTLRPGEQRWPFLQPFVVDEGQDDSAAGVLYDTGHGYPAAKFHRPGVVHGRVYPLNPDRLDECLELLDEVEGAVQELYHRVAITTSGGIDAWAYEYCDNADFPVIVSGDWMASRLRN